MLPEVKASSDGPRPAVPNKPSPRPTPIWLQSAGAFRARFGDLDRPWAELEMELWNPDWSGVPEMARPKFVKMLADWPDAMVRARAGYAFAAWNEIDALSELVQRSVLARPGQRPLRSAYTNRKVRLRSLTCCGTSCPGYPGSQRMKALDSAVALSERDLWVPRCADILADPTREDELRIQHSGLWTLGRLESRLRPIFTG